ncbi:murein transglycosylase [Amylibacter marinus]|uniref:Murein transglycosylase n=1 Tax=Amylibacter marinus TaxID=1475483 RepID=A0ABQ5VRM0_9RHOB|nr:lytic transglycosylase domain-containing protein [Amylibacter marinus]GLQ33799.1 murein transglycosylase [Amylibacter marinus]
MSLYFRVIGVLCLCFGVVSTALAQETSAKPTFKRVKVENRPVGSKINIQIDPEEQALALAPPENPRPTTLIEDRAPEIGVAPAPVGDLQDWFWSALSPDIKDAAFDRMLTASRQMGNAPKDFYQPSLQSLQTIAVKFGKEILVGSLDTGVSPALILAVIAVESAGKVDAQSKAGAKGLMQLIPDTAARFGVTDSSDPAQNIAGGAAYLGWLLKEFENDPLLALAGYNAGENAVKKNGAVPPYPETRAYVPKVVAAWMVARNLCTSPPVLVTEACIFRAQSLKQ